VAGLGVAHLVASPARCRKEIRVTVIAFSTPESPDWRWRIIDYTGDAIEE